MTYQLTGTDIHRPIDIGLEDGRLRIGRGDHNDLRLQASSVSRTHAEIVVTGEQIELRDLGSSNGTWVNGARIRAVTRLQAGDRLRFGDVELTLMAPGATHVPDSPLATVFASPEEVSAMERLSLEDAQRQTTEEPAVENQLFRAVTEASQMLMEPRPLEEIFEMLLDMVEGVFPARRIQLLLSDDAGGEPRACAVRPPASLGERIALSRTILKTVLDEREALLLLDTQTDPRFAGQESIMLQNLRSAMVAPLFDNRDVIGLLYLDSDDPGVKYDRDQLRAFTMLANLAAVKISNTRLQEAQREKERMDRELEVAAKLQRNLLLDEMPEITGYETLATQAPCYEVGGDLYDIAPFGDGRWIFVLGDVTGKGMGAALLMSNIMACLRVLYEDTRTALALVERLHNHVLRSSDLLHSVTLFVGVLDPAQHRLEYVNAGHNPPVLIGTDRKITALPSTGMPVGLLPGATFEAASIEFFPGSLLCVFSDAFPEAQVGEEFYGDDRFHESLRNHGGGALHDLVDGVMEDLHAFLAETPVGDDATLLLLRRRL